MFLSYFSFQLLKCSNTKYIMNFFKSGVFQSIKQYYLPFNVLNKPKHQVELFLFILKRCKVFKKILDNLCRAQLPFISFLTPVKKYGKENICFFDSVKG